MKFGDIVKLGEDKGVIVGIYKARKWTYFHVVPENPDYHTDDWMNDLVEYETYREDKLLELIK